MFRQPGRVATPYTRSQPSTVCLRHRDGWQQLSYREVFVPNLLFATRDGATLIPKDLRRRRLELVPGGTEEYNDGVPWKNSYRRSVRALAKALCLSH